MKTVMSPSSSDDDDDDDDVTRQPDAASTTSSVVVQQTPATTAADGQTVARDGTKWTIVTQTALAGRFQSQNVLNATNSLYSHCHSSSGCFQIAG